MKVGSALILLALILSTACSKSKEKEESKTGEPEQAFISATPLNKSERNIAAVVNGVPVYETALNKRTLEEVIDDELLYQAALKAGVDKVIEPLAANYKVNEIIKYYKDKIPTARLHVSDEDIKAYYSKSDYETISVTEVSFTNGKLASEFYKRAIAGGNFSKLAKEYTSLPSIAQLRVKVDNSYRDIFKGKNGGAVIYSNGKNGEYKVVRLNERLVIPYDSVRQSIASKLLKERIYQEAIRDGIDPDLERKIGEYKRAMILKNFRQNVIVPRSQVTDQEILEFYNNHEYQRISVTELVLKDKALADQAHDMIVSGEEFDSISKEYSKDPSKATIRNASNPPYQQIFKGKEVGEVSDVIEDGGTFKIVKLVKREKIPLQELRGHITSRVREKNAEKTEKELVQKLRSESRIKIISN